MTKLNNFLLKLHLGVFTLHLGVPTVAQWVKKLTSIHEDVGLIPGFVQWVKDLMLPQGAV